MNFNRAQQPSMSDSVCRYESLGSEGYHSLYRWYQAFEATHFPDPMGLRETVANWTLGVYPKCLKYTMAVFDVPESIAVTRKLLCHSGVASVSRIQVGTIYFKTYFQHLAKASCPFNEYLPLIQSHSDLFCILSGFHCIFLLHAISLG